MFRNQRRKLSMLIACAVLAFGVTAVPASADIGPRSPAETRTLIRRMAKAVGGDDRLAQIDSVITSSEGTRWTLDEGEKAGDGAAFPGPYSLVLTTDSRSHKLRLDYDLVSFGFVPRQLTEIVTDEAGYLIGQNANFGPPVATAMLSDRLVSTRIHHMLMNPQVLIRSLLDGEHQVRGYGPVDLRTVPHELLVVNRTDAPPLRVFVDRASGLISRIDTMENDPLRRDVPLVFRYNDWRWDETGNLRSPMRVKVFYAGELIQDEARNSIAVNPTVDDSLFDPPAGATPVVDPLLVARGTASHQHLQSFAALGFPLDGLQLDVTSTELSPGVHWLTGGSHHSLLVEHDDGLILVDAPQNEYRAQALLDHIEANFSDRPITHLVQSHFHADHSAGARTVVATGADLAVQRSAARFWRGILRAPSTIVPDALAMNRRRVDIVTVADGGSTTIGSGPNAVELHSFDQPHADDLLLIVAGGVAFIVDLYSPDPTAPIPPAGQLVLDVIADRGLDVHTIAGGHGGFIRLDVP